MTGAEDNREGRERVFPATVAKIMDHQMVVLNRGASHGMREGERFLVYELSEHEIKDPDSGEALGYLERVKAIGMIVNAQDKMCTLGCAPLG